MTIGIVARVRQRLLPPQRIMRIVITYCDPADCAAVVALYRMPEDTVLIYFSAVTGNEWAAIDKRHGIVVPAGSHLELRSSVPVTWEMYDERNDEYLTGDSRIA